MVTEKCKACNAPLEAVVSPCTDQECCGIDHVIQCSEEPYGHPMVLSTYDYDTLEQTWLEMGGSKKDLVRD